MQSIKYASLALLLTFLIINGHFGNTTKFSDVIVKLPNQDCAGVFLSPTIIMTAIGCVNITQNPSLIEVHSDSNRDQKLKVMRVYARFLNLTEMASIVLLELECSGNEQQDITLAKRTLREDCTLFMPPTSNDQSINKIRPEILEYAACKIQIPKISRTLKEYEACMTSKHAFNNIMGAPIFCNDHLSWLVVAAANTPEKKIYYYLADISFFAESINSTLKDREFDSSPSTTKNILLLVFLSFLIFVFVIFLIVVFYILGTSKPSWAITAYESKLK